MKKRRNPLNGRVWRELREDLGKYLVIFFLMIFSIALVSGFLVADNSMLTAYREGFEKYNIEDGNFTSERKLNRNTKEQVESLGVSLYDLFYTEKKTEEGASLRIFKDRDQVDRICIMEGRMPEKTGEIAIDRMFADNNKLSVGDRISCEGTSWTITGLLAFSDYSSLFENNSDTMFDATLFSVAIVSDEEFDAYDRDFLKYRYAWKYDNAPADKQEAKEASENFLEELNDYVTLLDYTPEYSNQAIVFSGDDMGGDGAMITAFLYIIIGILAFVFGVTISSTISKEATVIGTLRASGYSKGELIWHYMQVPFLVTLISALVGNILGYTILKKVCASMYYGSYSLPTYVTVWNGDAFWKTTLVPILLMLTITYFILRKKLSFSPLKFLRRDLRKKKNHHAIHLREGMKIFTRYRIRVLTQNIPNYITMAVGILFANLLLLYGLILPDIMTHYQDSVSEMMIAEYQYILQIPADALDEDDKLGSMLSMMEFAAETETENATAEKFSAYSLETIPEKEGNIVDSVTIYGVKKDSSYFKANLEEGEVMITSAYADKYRVGVGDHIRLKESYEDKSYEFLVSGIYEMDASIAVFMPQEDLNETFDLGEGTYSGYFSDTEITDIPEKYIGTVVDYESLTKVSRQLMKSMGNLMYLLDAFGVVMFMILIYLLSKVIIEKNTQSISMAKILGMTDAEIKSLYIRPTSFICFLLILLSIPVSAATVSWIWELVVATQMSGWIRIYINPKIHLEMIGLGFGTYLIVAYLEYRKIKKIPMEEALKNVE
jgi:putative ABC transport system permease protein